MDELLPATDGYKAFMEENFDLITVEQKTAKGWEVVMEDHAMLNSPRGMSAFRRFREENAGGVSMRLTITIPTDR